MVGLLYESNATLEKMLTSIIPVTTLVCYRCSTSIKRPGRLLNILTFRKAKKRRALILKSTFLYQD